MTEVYTDLAKFKARLRDLDLIDPEPRRPARSRWTPSLLRVYGIRPWEIGRFTVGELRLLADDIKELNEAYG